MTFWIVVYLSVVYLSVGALLTLACLGLPAEWPFWRRVLTCLISTLAWPLILAVALGHAAADRWLR